MATESIDKLRAEGWVEQFTASGPRLEEAVENYLELGFEVKTVPVKDLDLDGCTVCFDDENDVTVMIFTREKSET
ncbi:MAG: hypothetical protein JSV52_10825 [Candidatus Zixiibacteriota bacterium]|nr:MAG: hypothetical protein JSV52_10825 [candidate division Zixibacteria bacterium]